jgi:hypothetical protein
MDSNDKWVFTRCISDAEIGQFIYADALGPDMNFSILYVVKGKHEDNQCDIRAVALAFDKRGDYEKLTDHNTEIEDAPVVHVAEEEMLYFFSIKDAYDTNIQRTLFPFSVIIDGNETEIEADCLTTDCLREGEYLWTIIEPLDKKLKRYCLLSTHAGSLLHSKKKGVIEV